MLNVTTLLYLVVLLWKLNLLLTVKHYLLNLKKVKQLQVLSKTLLITVHSLILVVLMVFFISQIWLGSVSSTLQKLLKLVKKLLLKYLSLTVNVTAYL
ncbi:Uncharacterised protein [Acinetobacter baumannii]|nr:Uncharacterised protein [Acinetobacter baumannii]